MSLEQIIHVNIFFYYRVILSNFLYRSHKHREYSSCLVISDLEMSFHSELTLDHQNGKNGQFIN